MITAKSYKKYDDTFLYWSFSSKDEERALRQLLKGTNTIIRHRHYITKIAGHFPKGQMTLLHFTEIYF